MVKLNRTTEYGLMALSYIRGKETGELASAREIAQHFELPFEILAKTLQRLKEQGLISSTYGTRGGYVLSKDLKTINLLDFLESMEGPVGLVSCVNEGSAEQGGKAEPPCCEYVPGCNLRPILSLLNHRISEFLSRISLDELTRIPIPCGQKHQATAHIPGAVTASAPVPIQGDEP